MEGFKMHGKMRHVIFSTDVCEEYFALHQNPEFKNFKDEILWDFACDNIYNLVNDECKCNLDVELKDHIVLTGNICRWNGSFGGYKNPGTKNIGVAIMKAMESFDGENTFKVYTEGGRTYLEQYGHDNPTNPSIVEFRMLNAGIDSDELGEIDIVANSVPITPYVNDVYGWESEVA